MRECFSVRLLCLLDFIVMETKIAIYGNKCTLPTSFDSSISFTSYKDKMLPESFDAILIVDDDLLETLRLTSSFSACGWKNILVLSDRFRYQILESLLRGRAAIVTDLHFKADVFKKEIYTPAFTALEVKLLDLLSYGLCTKELCISLDKSERSIRRIKTKLLEKTGLFSTQQLVAYSLARKDQNSALLT